MLMTLYFNGVQNYSQDFTLPYGPIYETKLQHDPLH